jgi:hypothetical protein
LLDFPEKSSGFSVSPGIFVDHQRKRMMRDVGVMVVHGCEWCRFGLKCFHGATLEDGVME